METVEFSLYSTSSENSEILTALYQFWCPSPYLHVPPFLEQFCGSIWFLTMSLPFLSSLILATSVHLAVESLVCQSLGSFLGYLYWYRWYLIVSLGQGKLSILLLCHLPRKSQYFSYSSDNYPEREELAHVVVLFLMFLEVSIQFSTVTAPIYNLTNSVQRFLFLCIFSSICYFLSFDNNHSNRYEMIINFHLTISIIDHLFLCLLAICMFLLADLSIQIICSFFNWVV